MSDLAPAVAAWEHTARAVLALGRDCDATDFAAPTECPGWTVKDLLAHVTGVERWLAPGLAPDPPHDPGELPHVRNDFARRVEVSVDLRRAVAGPDVVAELAEVIDARCAALAGASADDLVVGPFGEQRVVDLLAVRTFDVWVHEQDLRAALNRPGGLGSPAAAVAVAHVRAGLGRVVARGARVQPGRTVVFDVRGPVSFTDAVEVSTVDGKARGTVVGADGHPDVRIVLGTDAFMRRSSGRWPVEATPVSLDGDADLGRRVLEAMAVTP
jgi:uncharacterized protein (TIGR03083 family)